MLRLGEDKEEPAKEPVFPAARLLSLLSPKAADLGTQKKAGKASKHSITVVKDQVLLLAFILQR